MMGKFQHPKVDAKEVNERFDPETLRMVFLPDVPPQSYKESKRVLGRTRHCY